MLSTQGELDIALDTLDRAQLPDGPAAGIMQFASPPSARRCTNAATSSIAPARALLQLPRICSTVAGSDEARAEGWSAHAALAMRDADYTNAAELYRRVLT